MEYAIRAANREDYDALCEVFEEVDALHREALPLVYRETDGSARSWEYIAGLLADEETALFVAESQGQVIVLVVVRIRVSENPLRLSPRIASVDTLVVVERFRRSGVGRALTERTHQWVRDRGVSQIELVVWEFNEEAMAFYEELGYTTARRTLWRSLS